MSQRGNWRWEEVVGKCEWVPLGAIKDSRRGRGVKERGASGGAGKSAAAMPWREEGETSINLTVEINYEKYDKRK
jgi:hypothetical protein